jgi:CHAD domain-containing protein
MKQPKQYLNNRLAEIFNFFQILPNLYTQETFHTLRVEIKKLHSFLALNHFCTPSTKKHFKTIHSVFHLAGKVRNDQLALEHVEKCCLHQLPTYQHWLINKSKRSKLQFFMGIQKISYKNIYQESKQIIKKTKSLTNYDVYNFIMASYISMLQNSEKETITQKNLHINRILLKRYLYTLKFSGVVQPKKQINAMTTLAELMGKWHDAEIVEMRIEQFIKKEKCQANELTHLLQYLLMVIKEKNYLFEQSKQEFERLMV